MEYEYPKKSNLAVDGLNLCQAEVSNKGAAAISFYQLLSLTIPVLVPPTSYMLAFFVFWSFQMVNQQGSVYRLGGSRYGKLMRWIFLAYGSFF